MPTFVPEHDHDVFISYAHLDNEPFPDIEEGWVSTLVEGLKIILARKLGTKDFSLWMDHDLPANKPITPKIMNIVANSATLVIIMSKGYLESEWCSRERNAFLRVTRQRIRSGSRVFIVECQKVNKPIEFEDITGYRFWMDDGKGKTIRRLGYPTPIPKTLDDRPYYNQLNKIGNELAEELRRMKSGSTPSSIDQKGESTNLKGNSPAENPVVFLAEVTDDLVLMRDEIFQFLDQAGFRVLPKTIYPRKPDAFQAAMKSDFVHSHVFVQLLSDLSGKKYPGHPSYCQLQNDVAREAEKDILQWRSPLLKIERIMDGDHRKLLEGDTVLAVGLAEFKQRRALGTLLTY